MRIMTTAALSTLAALSLVSTVSADPSRPVVSERHDRPPGSESFEIRAQCSAAITVSWTSKPDGRRATYDRFSVEVDGRPALSEEQRRDAVAAMNRLSDRHGLNFVGGQVRCDPSSRAGTVRIFSDPGKRGSSEGYLFLILDDRHGGLMFKPSSGPPVQALSYARR